MSKPHKPRDRVAPTSREGVPNPAGNTREYGIGSGKFDTATSTPQGSPNPQTKHGSKYVLECRGCAKHGRPRHWYAECRKCGTQYCSVVYKSCTRCWENDRGVAEGRRTNDQNLVNPAVPL